jgi:hypothetical protein
MDRTLFHVEVKESSQGRSYWLDRPWMQTQRLAARDADILVVPWENFREGFPAVFPQGTSQFVVQLREATGSTVAIAIDKDQYVEITLHSNVKRYATLLVTLVALPTVASTIGNLLSHAIEGAKPDDTVELKLLVEDHGDKCISIEYKGPPGRAVETVVKEAERCLPPAKEEPLDKKYSTEAPMT